MVQLIRRSDWRERLAAWVCANRATPFAWASANCGLRACDAIQAMTGADLAASMRGGYSTSFGLLRQLRRQGFTSVADYFDAQLERRTGPPCCGDLLGLGAGPVHTMAISDGRGAAWAQGEAGLTLTRLPAALIAWRV